METPTIEEQILAVADAERLFQISKEHSKTLRVAITSLKELAACKAENEILLKALKESSEGREWARTNLRIACKENAELRKALEEILNWVYF